MIICNFSHMKLANSIFLWVLCTCLYIHIIMVRFFSCCVYRGHEVRPCFNNCTTCAHNSGLLKFELPRLSGPGVTWRWNHVTFLWTRADDTKVKIKTPDTWVLHQYYMSQHRKVQLRNGTIVSLHMHMFCYARYDKNTHDSCPREHK